MADCLVKSCGLYAYEFLCTHHQGRFLRSDSYKMAVEFFAKAEPPLPESKDGWYRLDQVKPPRGLVLGTYEGGELYFMQFWEDSGNPGQWKVLYNSCETKAWPQERYWWHQIPPREGA